MKLIKRYIYIYIYASLYNLITAYIYLFTVFVHRILFIYWAIIYLCIYFWFCQDPSSIFVEHNAKENAISQSYQGGFSVKTSSALSCPDVTEGFSALFGEYQAERRSKTPKRKAVVSLPLYSFTQLLIHILQTMLVFF